MREMKFAAAPSLLLDEYFSDPDQVGTKWSISDDFADMEQPLGKV